MPRFINRPTWLTEDVDAFASLIFHNICVAFNFPGEVSAEEILTGAGEWAEYDVDFDFEPYLKTEKIGYTLLEFVHIGDTRPGLAERTGPEHLLFTLLGGNCHFGPSFEQISQTFSSHQMSCIRSFFDFLLFSGAHAGSYVYTDLLSTKWLLVRPLLYPADRLSPDAR